MHIPDGFLSAPVWASLDAAAVPAVGLLARRAQRGFADSRAPLLGVMGAFVFAAQMINFPVGVGTSGHLVGGALLTYTLGPSAAAIVMTAILAIQALVFQDGGILALGANVVNMALAGVVAAYLVFHLLSARWRRAAIFLGGLASVLVSALLALAELGLSGIRIPPAVLGVSAVLFVVSAALEGAITLVVIEALEAVQPKFVCAGSARRAHVLTLVGVAAVFLAAVGVLFASTHPDGLEKLVETLGIAAQAKTLVHSPLADYEVGWISMPWLRKAGAGLAGLVLIYAACLLLGRLVRRRRTV